MLSATEKKSAGGERAAGYEERLPESWLICLADSLTKVRHRTRQDILRGISGNAQLYVTLCSHSIQNHS